MLRCAPIKIKNFLEPNIDKVTLSTIKLQTIPSNSKLMKAKADQKPKPTRSFLLIHEKEFPHLFQNEVVKHQKMSKYFDEQDFNSDCETINRNKDDLLKQLSQSICRFTKSDPTKFVENLKSPAYDTDVSLLEKRVNQIKRGVFSLENKSSTEDESSEACLMGRN